MLYFRRSRFLRFVILPLTLAAFLPACHKWVPLKGLVSQALADAHPDPVRLTVSGESEQFELTVWRVESDTVFGAARNRSGASIPIADVQAVEGQESKPLAIVGLVLGAGLVAVGVGFALAFSDGL